MLNGTPMQVNPNKGLLDGAAARTMGSCSRVRRLELFLEKNVLKGERLDSEQRFGLGGGGQAVQADYKLRAEIPIMKGFTNCWR